VRSAAEFTGLPLRDQGPIGTPPTRPALLAGAWAAASRALAASALSRASSACAPAVVALCGAAGFGLAPADGPPWTETLSSKLLVLTLATTPHA
jgi:hypothetical protein